MTSPAVICAEIGHQPAGPRADGWIFCARCGAPLTKLGGGDPKRGGK